ncbi:unnamed protein product, partial [Meganyctiphanes norvegica]
EGDDLEYEWSDDTWNVHVEPMLSGQTNWNLTYDARNFEYYTGIREVTLKVKKRWSLWIYASASIYFHLSRYLNGELIVSQGNVSILTPGYISTGNQTNLTVLVDDPNNWMMRRTEYATVFWIINNKVIATCNTPSLLINITEPQDYQIQANVYLGLSNDIITTPVPTTTTTTTATTHITTTSNQTTQATTTVTTNPTPESSTQPHTTMSPMTTAKPPPPNNHTWVCSGMWSSSRGDTGVGEISYGLSDVNIRKYGSFFNSTKAREPIDTLNVTGSQWLKRDQPLNLTVQCSGSGSWAYCFTILPGSYNVTGEERCQEPLVTTVCDFKLIHLFRRNGTFSYLIIITNEVSTQIQAVPIKIYNVGRKPQLSYIIVPVSCSLVVIIIIIFGSAYLMQSRKRYLVEVADFDFVASTDVMYNKTMCEQLRDSFAAVLYTNNDDSDDDDDTQWRERSRIVESPRFLESGTHYGALNG